MPHPYFCDQTELVKVHYIYGCEVWGPYIWIMIWNCGENKPMYQFLKRMLDYNYKTSTVQWGDFGPGGDFGHFFLFDKINPNDPSVLFGYTFFVVSTWKVSLLHIQGIILAILKNSNEMGYDKWRYKIATKKCILKCCPENPQKLLNLPCFGLNILLLVQIYVITMIHA